MTDLNFIKIYNNIPINPLILAVHFILYTPNRLCQLQHQPIKCVKYTIHLNIYLSLSNLDCTVLSLL